MFSSVFHRLSHEQCLNKWEEILFLSFRCYPRDLWEHTENRPCLILQFLSIIPENILRKQNSLNLLTHWLTLLKICYQLLVCWLDWVCLTTTHVLQDILAVLHRLMCLKNCFHSLKSCPIQVNVSQSCFHSLNNYSSLIILSMSGG